jgi:hypothetical protein
MFKSKKYAAMIAGLSDSKTLICMNSYGKISLELCKFSEKPPLYKMRLECVLVKEYDVNMI